MKAASPDQGARFMLFFSTTVYGLAAGYLVANAGDGSLGGPNLAFLAWLVVRAGMGLMKIARGRAPVGGA